MGRDHSEAGEGPHRLGGKSQGCGTPWKLQKTAPLFRSCELREMRPGFIHSLMLPKVQVMVSELITKPKPAPAAQALGWWAVNSEIMTKKTQKNPFVSLFWLFFNLRQKQLSEADVWKPPGYKVKGRTPPRIVLDSKPFKIPPFPYWLMGKLKRFGMGKKKKKKTLLHYHLQLSHT